MANRYIARVQIGRKVVTTAEFDTREDAAKEAFRINPKAKSVATGYGYNGSFDIRFHRPADILAQ